MAIHFFILLFLQKLSTAVWCTLKCVDIVEINLLKSVSLILVQI